MAAPDPRPLTTLPVPAGGLLADVSGALRLLDALDVLAGPARRIVGRVEAELGVSVASLGVLRAVADGTVEPDARPHVTRPPVSLPAAAVSAVLDGLRAGGLLTVAGPLRPTERGRVLLDQADALGVRVADVITAVLGADDTATLARLLERLAAGLPTD